MLNKKYSPYENFDRREAFKIGSNKSFGVFFSFVFIVLAIVPLFFQHPFRLWALALGLIFLLLAFLIPAALRWPNFYWTQLGLFLNRVFSPIALLVLFFIVFFPVGFFLKIFKKDVLNLKINKLQKSYWLESNDQITSMHDQF